MKIKTLQQYNDPGHGWLKVEQSLLTQLGLSISPWSYQRGNFAYLEEDGDAEKLLVALKGRDITVQIQYNHTNRTSRIRGYQSYDRNALVNMAD